VRNSSNVLIQYGKLIGETDEEVVGWLKERDFTTNTDVQKLNGKLESMSGQICSAWNNLVRFPERIDLDSWDFEKGKCKRCCKVKDDLTLDIKYRSVCTQFVATLPKGGSDSDEESSGNRIVGQIWICQLVALIRALWLLFQFWDFIY